MIPLNEVLIPENEVLLSIAFFGAFFANLIRLSADRRLPIETRLYKDWIDIGCYLFLFPIIGGFLVLVYILEGTPLTSFLVLHIGVTAPLTISALAGFNSSLRGERINEDSDIRVD